MMKVGESGAPELVSGVGSFVAVKLELVSGCGSFGAVKLAGELRGHELRLDDHASRAYVMGGALLVALPDGYKPEQVAPALAAKIKTLPDSLRRTLTWDQGPEMRDWKQILSTPGSRSSSAIRTPRGSAAPPRTPTACCASTSPRGPTSARSPRPELDRVADELNDRPRKRLGFYKPSERIAELCGLRGGSGVVNATLRFRGWRLP